VVLEAGLASFPPSQPATTRDLVLLLTDGQLDLGQARRADEAAVLAHIRQTLVPQYRDRGIMIYSLAFTEGADQALLQEIAAATGGAFLMVADPDQLHRAFSQLFLQARQAESVPVMDHTVLLDDSIQDATFIISKRGAQAPVTLLTPARERLRATSKHPDVTWTSTPAYEVVQMTNPVPGAWQVEGPHSDADSLAVVGGSTVQLQCTVAPDFREAGAPVTLTAFLTRDGQRLQAPEVLQHLTVDAVLTTPQGETHTLSLARHPDGAFVTTWHDLHDPGAYHLQVTARSAQLHRQRPLAFMVYPPCFLPEVASGPPATIRVTLADACPPLHDLRLEVRHTGGETPSEWTPLAAAQPGLYTASLDLPPATAAAAVTLRIQGRVAREGHFTVHKGPWTLAGAASPAPAGVPWQAVTVQMLWKLCLLNGALGLAGGGGYGIYVFLQRKREMAHG
jgi:hypothetical protein